MKSARMIGNYAQNRAHSMGIPDDEINSILGFTDRETRAFYKGRLMLTYDQLSVLAEELKISVQNLIDGDEETYTASVVHCMNDFDDDQKRDFILDIIDDYMDVRDSLLEVDD